MVGGAEAQLVRLAARLVARGDDVRLVSLLPTEADEKEMEELGVPILELRGGRVRSVVVHRRSAAHPQGFPARRRREFSVPSQRRRPRRLATGRRARCDLVDPQ